MSKSIMLLFHKYFARISNLLNNNNNKKKFPIGRWYFWYELYPGRDSEWKLSLIHSDARNLDDDDDESLNFYWHLKLTDVYGPYDVLSYGKLSVHKSINLNYNSLFPLPYADQSTNVYKGRKNSWAKNINHESIWG